MVQPLGSLMLSGPSDKLSRDILALDREQCSLVIRLLRWQLHVTGLLESDTCRKCGQEEESSRYALYEWPVLDRHRIQIFSSAWSELRDINRALIKMVLTLAL
jgi:hypothetical protein